MLALALGRTVRELDAMESAELTHWQAFYRRNPWGPERADLRAGIVAATVANLPRMFGFSKGKALPPSDFMPKFGQTEKEPDPEVQWQRFRALAESYNARVVG